jgi:hypothetical protein
LQRGVQDDHHHRPVHALHCRTAQIQAEGDVVLTGPTYQSRILTIYAYIEERSTPDERQLFREQAKAKVAELGGSTAATLEGEAADHFLAFMEAKAENIGGM